MQFSPRTNDVQVWQSPVRSPARTSLIPYPLFFACYAAFSVYFYFTTIEPYLLSSDLFAPRILADAITYEAICVTGSYFLDMTTLRDIGPCTALRLFAYNSGYLSIFNAFIMVAAVIWLAKVFQRPWKPMLSLFMINPITFFSIFGPNKEVFGLVAFAALAIFIHSRSLLALLLCLIAAIFTRIPTFVVISMYCLLLILALTHNKKIDDLIRRRYYLLILFMIVVTSALAALFGGAIQYSFLGDLSLADDVSQSTALSLSINSLSRIGLYILVYIARLILNLFSGMIGAINLISGDGANYYTVAVAGSSIMFALLSWVSVLGRRSEDMQQSSTLWNIVLFAVMFTLMICLSPVIQHRYFYPLYVFLLLLVVKQDESSKPLRQAEAKAPCSVPILQAGEGR